jgi:hypothetical protein
MPDDRRGADGDPWTDTSSLIHDAHSRARLRARRKGFLTEGCWPAKVETVRYCATGSAMESALNVVTVETGGRAPVLTAADVDHLEAAARPSWTS